MIKELDRINKSIVERLQSRISCTCICVCVCAIPLMNCPRVAENITVFGIYIKTNYKDQASTWQRYQPSIYRAVPSFDYQIFNVRYFYRGKASQGDYLLNPHGPPIKKPAQGLASHAELKYNPE